MKGFGKIVGINLAILLAYSILIRLMVSIGGGGSNDRSMGIMLFSAFAVGVHLVVCLIFMIVAFSSADFARGRNWLATSATVLLVGFSVCLGNTALG